jgi:hypothetical protein
LHQIASVVLVADHPEGDGERPPLVAFDQLAECRSVTSLGCFDENTVFLCVGTSGF